jgi:RND family efflux transporter MFP subunit
MTDEAGGSRWMKFCRRLRDRAKSAGAPFWKNLGIGLASVLGLVLVLLYLQGNIGGDKVAPGSVPIGPESSPTSHRTAVVEKAEIEDVLEWPGTIRSRAVAQVAARFLARVLEVKAEVGTAVRAGEALAVLDDRDVRARADQAKAALEGAKAQAVLAQADYDRMKGLFEKEAATRRDFEAAEARAKSAQAQVNGAEDGAREAEVMLTETAVRAPFDGVVAEKFIQAGDTAVPGKTLFVLHDPSRLRLEVQVPESCASKASIGMEVRTRFDSMDREVLARIEEISPVADPQSRTFLLKASLPIEKELRSGAFGRLLQPCGKKVALLVPASAVTRTGQLEAVRVVEGTEARLRHVRTGKGHGDRVEILSGLREGEKVLVP